MSEPLAPSDLRFLLAPELPFAELAARLAALGWQRDPQRVEFAQAAREEHEFASWSHPATIDGELEYVSDEQGRLLCLRGAAAPRLAAQLARALPCLPLDGAPAPPDPADPRTRRQAIRRLASTLAPGSPVAAELLAAALADPDWELRASAALLAARLRLRELAPLAARIDLAPADGPIRYDAGILRAAAPIIAHMLRGVPVAAPPPGAPPPAHRQYELYSCIAGLQIARPSRALTLVHSLTTPLPDLVAAPSLPPGVIEDGAGYRLGPHGPRLAWVPPMPHWIGDDDPGLRLASPVRQLTPGGFFIAAELYRAPGAHEPLRCAHAEAAAHCHELSARYGLRLRLPTADEWEMAARGPDGRRFPWGNGRPARPGDTDSPWGLRDALAGGEWADDAIACGASGLGCAARTPLDAATPLAFRFLADAR